MEHTHCPGCGRHCPLTDPHCPTGETYRDTGELPQHIHHHSQRHTQEPKDYSAMDVPGRLILNLRDLGHIVRLLYEGKGSQTGILIRLKDEGPMTQSQLTEKLGIQPGSASEVLGKLEAAGLILRTPNPEDRRTADIRLTSEGQTQAEAAADRRQMRHEEMFQGLTQAEQETLLELLERLNRQWTETYGRCKHQERPHRGRGHHRHG